MVASNLIVKILTKDEANASSDHDGGEPSAASRVCDERPGKIAGPPLTPTNNVGSVKHIFEQTEFLHS